MRDMADAHRQCRGVGLLAAAASACWVVVLVAQDGDSTLLSVAMMSLFWFLARASLGGDVDTGHFSPPRRPSGARLCGEAQEIGSSYFCTEQGADINEQLINNTGLDGCSVSVPN